MQCAMWFLLVLIVPVGLTYYSRTKIKDGRLSRQSKVALTYFGWLFLCFLVATTIQGFMLSPDATTEGAKRTPRKTVKVEKPEKKTEEDRSTMAFVLAQDYVKSALKSPSTADFPWLDFSSESLGDGLYKVRSYVDAQNTFGATVRHSWEVGLRYKGKGEDSDPTNWELIRLHIDGKVLY